MSRLSVFDSTQVHHQLQQFIWEWVVLLLIVHDGAVQSGDLFWVRFNLKHMEHGGFLGSLMWQVLDLFLAGTTYRGGGGRGRGGVAYHSDTGCQRGCVVQEGKWQYDTCVCVFIRHEVIFVWQQEKQEQVKKKWSTSSAVFCQSLKKKLAFSF